ncbi:MAG: hypothetical protein DLM61_05620 [Pseudonocardiales bacterium]|nr:MAG: hypothetical protein DLM61_05620 [Pseudonocardiales bacterium]
MAKTTRRSKAGGRKEQPTWQPVTAVGMLTSVVAEQLEHTHAQLVLMEQARPTRPDARILDDRTVSETLRVYGRMSADYHNLFAEQGRRSQADPTLSATQAAQVDAYVALVDEHIAVLDDILALTRQVQGHTIEKIMAKSDLELGIEALRGRGHLGPD